MIRNIAEMGVKLLKAEANEDVEYQMLKYQHKFITLILILLIFAFSHYSFLFIGCSLLFNYCIFINKALNSLMELIWALHYHAHIPCMFNFGTNFFLFNASKNSIPFLKQNLHFKLKVKNDYMLRLRIGNLITLACVIWELLRQILVSLGKRTQPDVSLVNKRAGWTLTIYELLA